MKRRSVFKKVLAVTVGLLMLFTLSIASFAAEDCDSTNATRFIFSDGGITVTEGAYTGYKVKNTSLTINDSGTYIVSGSCANGTIVIKKNITGVTLILDSLTLTASATAPITCGKGSGVTIVAAAGSVNAFPTTNTTTTTSTPTKRPIRILKTPSSNARTAQT